jgi:DNA-binding transcriptional regulator YiaG
LWGVSTRRRHPMGKLEQTIKLEIVRLAKKQVRATCVPLARHVRRLKRTVKALSATVSVLAKLGAELQAERAAAQARLEAPPEEVKTARISALLIKKLRRRLGISQGELAVLVGVSAGAVGFWEQGKARPRGRNKEALVATRKLGRREVRKLLAAKKASKKPPAKRRAKRKIRTRKRAAARKTGKRARR